VKRPAEARLLRLWVPRAQLSLQSLYGPPVHQGADEMIERIQGRTSLVPPQTDLILAHHLRKRSAGTSHFLEITRQQSCVTPRDVGAPTERRCHRVNGVRLRSRER
jgi:hypothetical protein